LAWTASAALKISKLAQCRVVARLHRRLHEIEHMRGLGRIRARDKLVSKLPVTGELLRGTLLERIVRHRSGCQKCARGEGHKVFPLTVTYPGHRTRQISVRRERVEEVRRWLANYQELKETVEAICELNHDLLRPERAAAKPRKKQHD
jgi:hypothetical protein